MLTLEEIENISFRKSRPGGYRAEEVDDFVDKVIKKVKALESENRELESRIDNLNEKIQEYKEKEDSKRILYYTDENGVKIYNENLEKIEVNDIDLAKFLKDNNLPSDYVYNIFKEEESNIDNPVYLIGDSTKPTMIKATQYKNLKVSCYFENNEIFYVLSYEEERAKE